MSANFGLSPEQTHAIEQGPKRLAMALALLRFISTQKQGATCDECEGALKLPHQSGSARYHELVKSGCLTPTGKKRTTKLGALALVHQISPTADFKTYIRHLNKKSKVIPGVDEKGQQVLAAGLRFIQKWGEAKTQKGREDAAVRLVDQLISIGGLK